MTSQLYALRWYDPEAADFKQLNGLNKSAAVIQAGILLGDGVKLVAIYDAAYLVECELDRAEEGQNFLARLGLTD